MRILFIISLIIVSSHIFGQQPPMGRYSTNLFTSWTETNNILFSSQVPQPEPGGGFYETLTGYPLNVDEFNTTNVNLYMDIFQPQGDTLTKRPLIIICFGGGFVAGSRDYWSMRLLCQYLARRGFVTATIDYRLGMNIFDEDLSKRAVYRGLQDGRAAIRFFKNSAANGNPYKIDPDNIYIGGHSAGAFISTHNLYLDTEAERPASTYQWTQGCGTFDWSTCICPDQGCLDCAGQYQAYTGNAKAAFSLAGALGDTLYIQTAQDNKMVMFHSSDDDTVPYDSGEPFSGITWVVVGDDLPVVYGSLPMSNRLTHQGVINTFHSYSSRGHSVHEQTETTLYSDIIPNISNFFFNQILKPTASEISGANVVCANDLTQAYSVQVAPDVTYLHWEVVGGIFASSSPYNHTATVTWDPTATVRTIKVTPYSCLDAKGDQKTRSVTIQSGNITNIWVGPNTGSWDNPIHWSLGLVPQKCHDVVIPSASNATIQMNNVSSEVHSLTIQPNTVLNVTGNSTLMMLNAGQTLLNGQMIIGQTSHFNVEYANATQLQIGNTGILNNQGNIILKSTTGTGYPLSLVNFGQIQNSGTIHVFGSSPDAKVILKEGGSVQNSLGATFLVEP